MKGFYKKIKFLALVIALCAPLYGISQPPPFDNGSGGDTQDTVPLDGGLSILLIAGAGYGAKKINEKRKKNLEGKTEQETTSETK
ncbi:MAG: hypothetical protein WCG87_12055 [Bacteroidota bacterium]